jgi:hypothetical protein
MISLCHPMKHCTRLLFCYRSKAKRQAEGYRRMSCSLVSEMNRVYRQWKQVPHGLPDLRVCNHEAHQQEHQNARYFKFETTQKISVTIL